MRSVIQLSAIGGLALGFFLMLCSLFSGEVTCGGDMLGRGALFTFIPLLYCFEFKMPFVKTLTSIVVSATCLLIPFGLAAIGLCICI
jgi:hypothetical protein